MRILYKARCRIVTANNGIIKSQFDIEGLPEQQSIGEYMLQNLLVDRGQLFDGRFYEVTLNPLFSVLKESKSKVRHHRATQLG